MVDEPTCENNILDLVLMANSELINNLEVGEPFSDHNSITFIVNTRPYQQRISTKENYAFNKPDWNHLRSLFSYSPWYFTLEQQDINANWEVWKDLYFAAVNESIPKYRHKRKNIAPWITKDLIKLSRKKKHLYKKAKKSNSEDHWVAYRTLNNTLKKKCNSAKWSHLKALADKLQVENNSKPFWNYMRSIRKGTDDLVFLKEGSAEIAGDQEIAQHMNAYFASVFTHEQRTLPEFDYVLDEKLCNLLCTPSEEKKHLKNLNIHKSPGPDKLLPRILKECALELSTSLCNLFNKSFQSGSLPSDWKIAHIIPVHKKGPKHKKENYRQISRTSIISKIVEKIVTSTVVSFWIEHQLLNPSQFGYLKGRSTVSQLLSCYNNWCLTRNLSKASDVKFLDLSNAFDSVPHERLLLKLNRNGIDGQLHLWFRNFLTN